MDLELVTVIDAENPTVGDLKLTNGQVRLTQTFKASVAQHLLMRLRFFFGEWFLNTAEGIPYFEQVLIKGFDLNKINSIFRKVIIETPGIDGLDNLTLEHDPATRTLTIANFAAKLSSNETLTAADFGAFIVGNGV